MKTDSVSVQMKEILEEYSEEVQEATNKSIAKTAKESVKKLRSTSPKRPGHGEYARGWTTKTVKKGGINDVIVHNKVYQLTHLLENGHIIRNKKGTYGRTNGIKHIAPVEQWANNELPEEIKRELE